jgi:hypothetical protein
MKFVLATALLLTSASAFAQPNHFRDLVNVCINSHDPTATRAYCTCTAQKFAQRPELEQQLLLEMGARYLSAPEPTPQQAQQSEAELNAQHRGDNDFPARLNLVKQAAAAADQACARHQQ